MKEMLTTRETEKYLDDNFNQKIRIHGQKLQGQAVRWYRKGPLDGTERGPLDGTAVCFQQIFFGKGAPRWTTRFPKKILRLDVLLKFSLNIGYF